MATPTSKLSPVTRSTKRQKSIYIPRSFACQDADSIARLVEANTFAMLIATDSNGHMQASNLPVLPYFDGKGHLHRLRGHLARSSEQADDLIRIDANDEQVLTVFHVTRLRVTPSLRRRLCRSDMELCGVHVYGIARVHEAAAQTGAVLDYLVSSYESDDGRTHILL